MLQPLWRTGVSCLLRSPILRTVSRHKSLLSLKVPPKLCQLFSTSMSTANNVECYISTHTDPFVNLAIEDYLFKSTDPEKYILYLWRNKPCVVVGRNHNPFKECNLQYMEKN